MHPRPQNPTSARPQWHLPLISLSMCRTSLEMPRFHSLICSAGSFFFWNLRASGRGVLGLDDNGRRAGLDLVADGCGAHAGPTNSSPVQKERPPPEMPLDREKVPYF